MTTDLEPLTPSGNGATPPAGAAPAAGTRAPADDEAADAPGLERQPGDLVIAMSPRQILGGFAVLAALILLLRRRRRKG